MGAKEKIKAIALVSSGLDSLLAAKIIHDQGIEVAGVHFIFRFDHTQNGNQEASLQKLYKPLGIAVQVRDITDDFLHIFVNPEHGYGTGVNPCIDCKIFMLKRAKKLMEASGSRFVVTGEVVGQRPMTQKKPMMYHIEKASNLKGILLRPLSAKLLPITMPEQRSWVDREKLYGISGRSRKAQMDLAKNLGITQYTPPAGGCILTDPQYARRAKVLLENRQNRAITLEAVQLLRLGRHLWPRKTLQVIVGRDEKDNQYLKVFRKGRWVFTPADFEGPLVLAEGVRDEKDRNTVAAITARYCGNRKASRLRIRYSGHQTQGTLLVSPLQEDLIRQWRI